VMNFTATMSKPLRVDDKVGKRKGRIDFDAKSDESSNDESEDDEDLTHQVSKKVKGKGDPLVTTTRRKSLPLNDKVRKGTMGKGKGKGNCGVD
jgi:hypothetical protein